MTILRCIEKLEKTSKPSERKEIIKEEYNNNRIFREYLHMIYGEVPPAIALKIPKYNKENIPLGLDYSNLERSLGKIKTALFLEELDDKKRNKLLIQIAESISEPELDMVKAIMKKRWKYLTIKGYMEISGLGLDGVIANAHV